METMKTNIEAAAFISAQSILDHWNGHRRLTRRVIEAFPEDAFFNQSIGGMRSFADMMTEILDLSGTGVKGIVTGEWPAGEFKGHAAKEVAQSKAAFLDLWDQSTQEINQYFPLITEDRFKERVLAFGQYEGIVYDTLLYFIENEIHHRAQGTVYLRSLGIEPPAFWKRD